MSTASDNPTAIIKTVRGNIMIELFPQNAPQTVSNFIKLAQDGFYDGTAFHRVVPDFVIQGGDPLSKDSNPGNDGTGGPGYTFADEINPWSLGLSDQQISNLEAQGYQYTKDLTSLPNRVGALAMANAGPNTNGSQFFIITTKDQPGLNGKHAVFGQVISGLDITRKIQAGDKIEKITVNQ
ncbi:MAG: peptidylprolyl isomerase [Candidatus Portnoybacteria bacterium CG10_big_fil_rev_8_21_14_0_10_44_7]|uniref:Peptidyl-prolyl cis-trans isomerase n=1 Tax=Candidatus Portnoybacteria bacterium CG10_big_fil_rev_8_21_14_0_10_44_7 TaxID=1974816 RepID=A0A2M8KIE0_9BACT|nr:MAG: peptidylprolyl isomerase [Candidatus Portnoybacteria bacterium CG10_big_fil_rev_8_21_14_0_10_44_7]